jgi:hypothetical protein
MGLPLPVYLMVEFFMRSLLSKNKKSLELPNAKREENRRVKCAKSSDECENDIYLPILRAKHDSTVTTIGEDS